MLESLSPRALVALAAAGSAAVLVAALIFQAAGYAPCDLCIAQRWPHLAAVLIGAALLAFRLPMWLAWAGAAAAASTGGIALYHSLVERKLIEGPASCTSSGPGAMSAADLLAQIQAAPLVRCDEIAVQILGVTMPNMNVIASALFMALWTLAALRSRRG